MLPAGHIENLEAYMGFRSYASIFFIPDCFCLVEKQADVMAAAVQAGKLPGERLTNGHDRAVVTQRVRDKMMSSLEKQPRIFGSK